MQKGICKLVCSTNLQQGEGKKRRCLLYRNEMIIENNTQLGQI